MAKKPEEKIPEFQEDPEETLDLTPADDAEETLEVAPDPSAEETFIEDDDVTLEAPVQEDPEATLEAPGAVSPEAETELEFDAAPEEEAAPATTASRRLGARRRPGRRPSGAGKHAKDEPRPGFGGGILVFLSIALMVAGSVVCALNFSEPGPREAWMAGGLVGSMLGLGGLGYYFGKWGSL